MTCIQCPRGCRLTVTVEEGRVTAITGNGCALGPAWARQEVEDPMRTLTSSVRVLGGTSELVSVRTGPIPRRRLAEALTVVKELRIEAPVTRGQVLVPDLGGTGVALVATRTVEALPATTPGPNTP